MAAGGRVRVRAMTRRDVAGAVALERRVTRSRGRTGLERNLVARLKAGSASICLAAPVGDRLGGFLVATVRTVEFGEKEPVGWIEVVGVDPEFQGQGLGHALGEEALRRLRTRGVRRVKTLVRWDAGEMVSYFRTLGFRRGDAVLLESLP
jgi:ribosomal protein S18 acetylase RimI-like enzyme